jgi:hypothetical protein
LKPNNFPGNVNGSNVESANAFHGNEVAFFEYMNSGVSVKVFTASVIEGYFYDLTAARRVAEWQITKPIVYIHSVTSARTTAAIAFAAGDFTACSA